MASALVISNTPKSKNLIQKNIKTDFASSKNLFIVALGSILGGFTGGMIEDDGKNKWKKIKESNFPNLSNVALPLLFLNIFKNANAALTKNFK